MTDNLPLLVRFPGDHQYRPPTPISWLRAILTWPNPFLDMAEPEPIDWQGWFGDEPKMITGRR